MTHSETFGDVFEDMRTRGMKVPVKRVSIRLDGAEIIFENAMRYFLSIDNTEYKHQPEYQEVVNWLTNNQGKGLFMYGNCGRGKTLIGRYVLPAILLKYCRRVVNSYDVTDLDKKIDEALKYHLLSIDDIGTETVAVNFGKKRMPFAEIIDAAEKYGKLVIITSNLNGNDLTERYGERVMDRIKSTCKRIVFQGKSLRK